MKNNAVTLQHNTKHGSRAMIIMLSLLLAGQSLLFLPSSHAIDALQVDNSAELIAAGLDPGTVNVKITKNIVLDANLVINHSMNITRGDLLSGSPTISAFGIEINSAAVVTMDHLTLTGQNVQANNDGNYGVMVQAGSKLTASDITMTLDTLNASNVGFNVAAASTLTLSNSTITWGTAVKALQQYAVYAQSGAGAIILSSNTFTFSANNVSGEYSYMVGMQGDLVANYPSLTLTSNVNNSYMKFLMYGADSAVNKQAWIASFVTTTVGDNRIGLTGGVAEESGIYTKLASAWGINKKVKNEAELRAAVLIDNAIVTLTQSIALLDTNLTMAKNATIHGESFTVSGKGLEISGASTVSIDYLTIANLNVQANIDGNYGVMIQDASHLIANNLSITLNTVGASNVGFNVASGSKLTLSDSVLTWGVDVKALQQYGVYAQSGAGAIVLNRNTFTFSANNLASQYSYLVGVQGDLVANYPTLTLTGNTSTAWMKLLVYGADTVAHKQAWATPYVTAVTGNNLAGIVNSSGGAIYTKYTDSWGVVSFDELQEAASVANAVVNLGKAVTLSANLNLANGVTLLANGFALNLSTFQIISAAATVTTVTHEVVTVVNGTTQVSQLALVAISALDIVQLGETASISTSGGSGTGAVSYLTTTPAVCSITPAGVVTGVSAGSCLVSATKAVSGNYFAAMSSVIAVSVSDAVAVANKAAAALAAEKAAAEKAAALAAEKAAAEKAAAEAAEGGGGAPIAKADLNTIRYAIATTTKTIFIDFADKYAGEKAVVVVKNLVLKDGKQVFQYVTVKTVDLDAEGRAKIKTTAVIKVGTVIRVTLENGYIKYITVK
jgi:hypothetical protein